MKEVIQNAELLLWDSVTEIMHTSPFVQKSMRSLYPLVEGLDMEKTIKTLLIAGVTSISMGWIIYFIIHFSTM
ncbi:MAG: hypothetical protein CVU39_16990 [Chloroflexi bacterium HGW-Chloroflexi-10]|nr:MAG: hypothetical protein CVU39_16990 [Chloroflexi bacterium HGW-Chloroflexi-10]